MNVAQSIQVPYVVAESEGEREGELKRRTKARTESGDGEIERDKWGEERVEVPATLAAAFSGEPLNRVVFAEESWDHPK